MKSVSVIIPTYKNRGGLTKSVDSVLSQSYEGIKEVIIVDDNNPDDTFRKSTEKLMSLYLSNPRVVYIKHEVNKNGAAARNTGIMASSGDYVAFLDDDDIFLPGKIEAQVEYLNTHNEHDLVYCLAKGNRYGASQRIIEGNGARDILMLNSNFYTPSLMFRRQALLDLNGFDESFIRHQDYELLLRYFAKGGTIGCVAKQMIEIGVNQGENEPKGERLEKLKSYFFSKFNSYIEEENKTIPGFKNKVLAKHYGSVFLSHIKNGYLKMALGTFVHYFFKSPLTFFGVVFNSLCVHIKAKIQ